MTQALPLPPLEVLQDKFIYDPETGILLKRTSGKPAGYTNGRGWLRVKVGDTHYRVHRIAWKMYYGEDPATGLTIDHINRNRSDNRIVNLRLVTQKENVANSAPVLFKKPKPKPKTPEELREIRKNAAKKTAEKTRKPIILISPTGQETWYPSITEAARAENLLPPGISQVLRGLYKQHKGYTARYA